MCRKKCKSGSKPESANYVDTQNTQPQNSESLREYGKLFQISSGATKPFHTTLMVNGRPLTMEVDTGTSDQQVYLQSYPKWVGRARVGGDSHPTTDLHRGGDCCQRIHRGRGKKYFDQTLELPLIVSAGDGPALLGRDCLAALRLDWKSISSIGKSPTLQEILQKHSEVFKEGLGELKGVAAKIHVDKNVLPEFHRANRVPFAMREKVERELHRLLSLGVIEPVEFSDWAAPSVPVLKGDGRIRICGDYKVTVNQSAKFDKYPIPRIDELFASLAGGKAFSKLDLSHAYLQIPLATESQKYMTVNTHKGLFKYTRLPFGVASAPSIFQRVMETLL